MLMTWTWAKRSSGHLGVRSFARRVCLATTKAAVKLAIWACKEWEKRKAEGEQKIAEVTNRHHAYGCWPFLDAYRLWSVAFFHLEAVGQTRLGKHNSTTGGCVLWVWPTVQAPYKQWHSLLQQFRAIAQDWRINLQFCCVYIPAGNDIEELCHHTMKRITARMYCCTQEAVYWHNLTPKGWQLAPDHISQCDLPIWNLGDAMTMSRAQSLPGQRSCVDQGTTKSMYYKV